ncbi:unnamed protein product [Chilo suppressalis]|uniref:MRN complex-interacting protein N-terminal domain-containing protein n=1 Tax=Chilo suppressalis TaxID=168631 RepID=A0ABN8BA89_CHISP|nr:unnamed protein product [Chilo suppressalis]
MPQVFQILRCYMCNVFQVHQTKKANKFACKMCGEKQSIKRHYGVGNGQECRGHVQKLNAMRGELNDLKITEDYLVSEDEDVEVSSSIDLTQKKPSKWSEYVDKYEAIETTDVGDKTMFLENKEVVLDIPKKKRQKRSYDNERPQKSYKMAKPEIDLGSQEKYSIESYAKTIESVTQNTAETKCKYGNLQKETTFDEFSEKNKSQEDYNNLENLDFCTASIQNCSKTLQTSKPSKLKFIPPIINANSKWAKFTESGNEQEEISKTEMPMPSNVYESQFDEININTNNTSNSKCNLANYDDEKKLVTDINLKQSNWILFPTDLNDVVTYERIEYTKDISNSDYVIKSNNNVNDKDTNRTILSTNPNNLAEYKNNNQTKINELDHNNKKEQISKENLKELFSLCSADEIDNCLDI